MKSILSVAAFQAMSLMIGSGPERELQGVALFT
jgi:hypothetical protein